MKSHILSIEYPFLRKEIPYATPLELFVNTEIDKYKCLPPSVRNMYKKSNFGVLTANVFPNASFQELIPMGRWMLVGFAFDDFYGSTPLEELEKISQKTINILKGKLPQPNDEEFFHQFAQTRKELLTMVSPYWLERFVLHHELWFEGMKIDTLYSQENSTRYPGIEEYKKIREKIVGGEIICDLIEIAAGFIMPEEVFSNPVIKRARQLLTLMMSWFNDIHSVAWELQRKEAMNLVLVIENERKCTREEAYREAIEIHNKDLEFTLITQNLPDFGIYNEGVAAYMHNAQLFLKGQELWYEGGTERYGKTEA